MKIDKKTKLTLTLAAILTFAALASHGAILASTNFDVTTISGNSKEDIVWTGDDLVSVTPNSAMAYTGGSGGFLGNLGSTSYAPNRNIGTAGPWSVTVDLFFNGAATGSLSSIEFDFLGLDGNGSLQYKASAIQPIAIGITVNGVEYEVSSKNTGNNASGTMTFTDTAVLNSGSNSVVITLDSTVATGYNAGIDNLTFYGTSSIPEPSSSALLFGIAGLVLIARRRR